MAIRWLHIAMASHAFYCKSHMLLWVYSWGWACYREITEQLLYNSIFTVPPTANIPLRKCTYHEQLQKFRKGFLIIAQWNKCSPLITTTYWIVMAENVWWLFYALDHGNVNLPTVISVGGVMPALFPALMFTIRHSFMFWGSSTWIVVVTGCCTVGMTAPTVDITETRKKFGILTVQGSVTCRNRHS